MSELYKRRCVFNSHGTFSEKYIFIILYGVSKVSLSCLSFHNSNFSLKRDLLTGTEYDNRTRLLKIFRPNWSSVRGSL